jgi:hypothetical protein
MADGTGGAVVFHTGYQRDRERDDPTGQGQRRWSIRWKPALNGFDIAFDGRLSAGRK